MTTTTPTAAATAVVAVALNSNSYLLISRQMWHSFCAIEFIESLLWSRLWCLWSCLRAYGRACMCAFWTLWTIYCLYCIGLAHTTSGSNKTETNKKQQRNKTKRKNKPANERVFSQVEMHIIIRCLRAYDRWYIQLIDVIDHQITSLSSLWPYYSYTLYEMCLKLFAVQLYECQWIYRIHIDYILICLCELFAYSAFFCARFVIERFSLSVLKR